jgi:hypothetical protein
MVWFQLPYISITFTYMLQYLKHKREGWMLHCVTWKVKWFKIPVPIYKHWDLILASFTYVAQTISSLYLVLGDNRIYPLLHAVPPEVVHFGFDAVSPAMAPLLEAPTEFLDWVLNLS